MKYDGVGHASQWCRTYTSELLNFEGSYLALNPGVAC